MSFISGTHCQQRKNIQFRRRIHKETHALSQTDTVYSLRDGYTTIRTRSRVTAGGRNEVCHFGCNITAASKQKSETDREEMKDAFRY